MRTRPLNEAVAMQSYFVFFECDLRAGCITSAGNLALQLQDSFLDASRSNLPRRKMSLIRVLHPLTESISDSEIIENQLRPEILVESSMISRTSA